MPYKLVVNRSNLGINSSHGEIFIHGLGAFDEGTHDISDEQAEHFRVVNSVDVGGYDMDKKSDSYGLYIPKQKLGPDLETAVESMHGVTVTKVKDSSGTRSTQGPVESVSSEAPANPGSE